MLLKNKENPKIVKFQKKRQLNIGIIIFGIIFIYLIATVVMYITAPHITVYEVRQGSILKDYAYTGLAIRDEIVVKADAEGYINYYAQDTSKVKVGANIYTLSEHKLNFEETSTSSEFELSSETEHNLSLKVQKFVQNYQDTKFSDVYDLKSDIKNSLAHLNSQSKSDQLSAMISQGTLSGTIVYPSTDDGVVVYSIDGLEGITIENVKLKDLDKSNHKKTEFTNNTKVKPGDAIYKIVTNDNWSLMIELDKDTYSILKEKEYVKVNFTKDDQTLWATLKTKIKDGKHIAFLSFENSMVRYAKERFLDIELILEDESGLKIPKSAITEKEFFVVPKSYITFGGNNGKEGVLKYSKNSDGNTITEFVNASIYYEDEEVVFLDPNEFKKGTILLKPESNDTFELNEKKTLPGVYCINKGYAVFKQINILCESDSYYIIEEGNSYGLSNYDHIALDSNGIKENDVVF